MEHCCTQAILAAKMMEGTGERTTNVAIGLAPTKSTKINGITEINMTIVTIVSIAIIVTIEIIVIIKIPEINEIIKSSET